MRDGKQMRSMERGCDESMFWIRISKLMAADGNVPRGEERGRERERARTTGKGFLQLTYTSFFFPQHAQLLS